VPLIDVRIIMGTHYDAGIIFPRESDVGIN